MAKFVHVKPNSEWKRLEIAPPLLSKKGFEDLICIEELTDYEIVHNRVPVPVVSIRPNII